VWGGNAVETGFNSNRHLHKIRASLQTSPLAFNAGHDRQTVQDSVGAIPLEADRILRRDRHTESQV